MGQGFGVAAVTAIVIVWRSRHWTVGEKWIGLALACILPAFVYASWNLIVQPEYGAGSDGWIWALYALVSALTLAGSGYLWRRKRS
ncbi:hypothetical protein [Streptomyces sp. NPDC047108]|uniref:hypothetical protein n=1 Tax=Streptomyces sp. NPDC047108 TaxID=3155025 RepID=UPI0033DCA86F